MSEKEIKSFNKKTETTQYAHHCSNQPVADGDRETK